MTLQPFTDALLPLALPLLGGTLANVRAQLSFVGRTIAVVGDAVPFIGDSISFIRDPVTPGLLGFTQGNCVLAAGQISGTPVQFARSPGPSVTDQTPTLAPQRLSSV